VEYAHGDTRSGTWRRPVASAIPKSSNMSSMKGGLENFTPRARQYGATETLMVKGAVACAVASFGRLGEQNKFT